MYILVGDIHGILSKFLETLKGSDNDVVGVNVGSNCDDFSHDDVYVGPIKALIEKSFVGACHSWDDVKVLSIKKPS